MEMKKITLWQKQHLTIVSENAHFWMLKLVILNNIFTRTFKVTPHGNSMMETPCRYPLTQTTKVSISSNGTNRHYMTPDKMQRKTQVPYRKGFLTKNA